MGKLNIRKVLFWVITGLVYLLSLYIMVISPCMNFYKWYGVLGIFTWIGMLCSMLIGVALFIMFYFWLAKYLNK